MLNKKFLFPVLIILLISLVFFFFPKNQQISKIQDHQKINILIGTDRELEVEVVNTNKSITQGLSGREEIGSDGMLFIFPQSYIARFWMKDMQFDLDFIWFDNNQVIDLTENASAPDPDINLSDLPTYSPQKPANMMLEVEAGKAKEWKVEVDDKLTFL